MRILLIHNHYGSEAPSGENQAYLLEKSLIEARGHEVITYHRFSDSIRSKGLFGKFYGGIASVWNPFSARDVASIVRDFQPHVMHAHNTFPLISNSVFPAAKGVARVITLHNYRLFCAAGVPLRAGSVCTECLDERSVLPALKYGCYRGSRAATLPLAAGIALNVSRGTWSKDVEAFIALNDFQRDRLARVGIPEDRIYIKPNFFPGNPAVVPWDERGNSAVFVGRLSEEKGADSLVDAWTDWGEAAPHLDIVGDGPMRGLLEEKINRSSSGRIAFHGYLEASAAQGFIAKARLLVLPSTCFEGFPMVIREAFALGTPVLVSNLGPLPDMISKGEGASFRAGDSKDLLRVARSLFDDQDVMRAMALAARAAFENSYNEDQNYKTLMHVYARAMDRAGVVA